MAADDDRLGSARNQPRHVVDDDRFAEDRAAQDVADRAVGRFQLLFEVEFLNARLVGGDRRKLPADAVLLDCMPRLDRVLTVGFVALMGREVGKLASYIINSL